MKLFSLFKRNKKNQFTKNNERFYRRVIRIMVGMYVLIFGLNFLYPNDGKFIATENGDVIQDELGANFKVINRYYDKKEKRYQLILWLDSDGQLKDDYQLELSAKSVIKANLNEEKPSQVTRFGRHYFSVVVSDIPDNYEAVRTELTVNKEGDSSEDEQESTVNLYSKASQTSPLTIDIGKEYFKNQAREVQLSEFTLDIKEIEKANKILQTEINDIKKLTADIESDLPLQLSEEKEESQRIIEENQSTIAQKENEISENLERIEELKESQKQVDANF